MWRYWPTLGPEPLNFTIYVEDFMDIRTMQLVLNISQIYMGVEKKISHDIIHFHYMAILPPPPY